MTKIKICGLKSEADIEYANKWKPDYIGFVFLKGRKRYVTPEQAKRFREKLNPEIPAVGVFVNEPVENVVRLLDDDVIQIAQLHGDEDEEYVKIIRAHSSKPIIKAFVIKTSEDIERTADFPCDYLLLDGGLGYGETFDWSLIQNVKRPFFLAGGLNADNVELAIHKTHPFAVDVSSGVETEDCKDEKKIVAFVNAVKRSTTIE